LATAKHKLLLVEDEPALRGAIRDYFSAGGFQVCEAEGCERARQVFESWRPDAAILDYSLPDGTALDLIGDWRASGNSLPIIVLTGHATIDLAVLAIKTGAEHFLSKPVQLQRLMSTVLECVEQTRPPEQVPAAQAPPSKGKLRELDPFVGTSAAIRLLAEQAAKVAASQAPVLLQGETGSGKGVLARWIHLNSGRAQKPLVELNCAGLSRELLESELFGHEKGAFTGATERRTGRFELAHGGTIFLDEIGELSLDVQAKLLRVLQEHEFERVGGSKTIRVDVRVIAATNRDLTRAASEGTFRQDLYYRLNVFPLRLPPLRERTDDIALLAHYFVARYAAKIGRRIVRIPRQAMERLAGYSWPGNVRELENVIERAVILSPGPDLEIGPEVVPLVVPPVAPAPASHPVAAPPAPVAVPSAPVAGAPSTASLEEVERSHILAVLKQTNWRIDGPKGAARLLNLNPSTLRSRMQKLGIQRSDREAS
jgi:DNA-binding NtrC family response regulator